MSAFQANEHDILPDKFKALKKDLLRHTGEEQLQESWRRLIEAFEKEIEQIRINGPEIIPQIEFSKISENNFQFPTTFADEVRKRGCVVVRNVVDRSEALKYKSDVQQYINNHEGKIAGFPGKRFYKRRIDCETDFHEFQFRNFRNESSSMGDLLVESKSVRLKIYIRNYPQRMFHRRRSLQDRIKIL